MEPDVEREFGHVRKELKAIESKVEDQSEELEEHKEQLANLKDDVLRFWHVAIGIAAGFLLDTLGLGKLLSRFL